MADEVTRVIGREQRDAGCVAAMRDTQQICDRVSMRARRQERPVTMINPGPIHD